MKKTPHKYRFSIPAAMLLESNELKFTLKQKLAILYANGIAQSASNEALGKLLDAPARSIAPRRAEIPASILTRKPNGRSEDGHVLYNYQLVDLELSDDKLLLLQEMDPFSNWCKSRFDFQSRKNDPSNFARSNLNKCPDIIFSNKMVASIRDNGLRKFLIGCMNFEFDHAFTFFFTPNFFPSLLKAKVYPEVEGPHRATFLFLVLCHGLASYSGPAVESPLAFLKIAISMAIKKSKAYQVKPETLEKYERSVRSLYAKSLPADRLPAILAAYYKRTLPVNAEDVEIDLDDDSASGEDWFDANKAVDSAMEGWFE